MTLYAREIDNLGGDVGDLGDLGGGVDLAESVPVEEAAEPPPRPTVTVVVPALNEARNLPHVAARMPADIDEIVFVDGHSVDDTVEVAKKLWPRAKIVLQTRRGKGNALACGFQEATCDIVVMIDADGSTDPAEIPRFVDALVAGADFAKGSRFIAGGGSSDITVSRRIGNKALNSIVNIKFGAAFTDLCYGYNAFWRNHVPVMQLPAAGLAEAQWGDGFEIETLINVRVANAGLRIAEVPSFEQDRIHGVSNLHAVRDGLRVLRTIRSEPRARPRVMSTDRQG
ncbi:glycosyltransferase family 2 protein [Rhodococcus sp. ABRD24]|uniref:glycosyltransferase family 2 protein n=1 Tax=Rhodococcus sp. ABRD24 TaxID=2507582 RepID=UPI00103B24DC|nr:glycosyltransferase family 2 protein [Rhodococcus sp. ABRD24]QBJ97631.1 glycosyltransferase family 2 protein [Rhodococcus sp. ABRD24]